MKNKTIKKGKLNKENCEIAKLIAKTRDKYTCQHCGTKSSGSNMHGSHTINEAIDHRLACNPENIIALCYHCHINWRHKNPLEASERFNNKFPGKYDELEKLHTQYMKEGSISLIRVIEQNEKLRSQAKKMGIDLSRFTYGLKIKGQN